MYAAPKAPPPCALAYASGAECPAIFVAGKTPEEIRKTFNIVNDFTPQEEEQVSDSDLDAAISEALAAMPASKAASEIAKRFNLNRSDIYQRILAAKESDGA